MTETAKRARKALLDRLVAAKGRFHKERKRTIKEAMESWPELTREEPVEGAHFDDFDAEFAWHRERDELNRMLAEIDAGKDPIYVMMTRRA